MPPDELRFAVGVAGVLYLVLMGVYLCGIGMGGEAYE